MPAALFENSFSGTGAMEKWMKYSEKAQKMASNDPHIEIWV